MKLVNSNGEQLNNNMGNNPPRPSQSPNMVRYGRFINDNGNYVYVGVPQKYFNETYFDANVKGIRRHIEVLPVNFDFANRPTRPQQDNDYLEPIEEPSRNIIDDYQTHEFGDTDTFNKNIDRQIEEEREKNRTRRPGESNREYRARLKRLDRIEKQELKSDREYENMIRRKRKKGQDVREESPQERLDRHSTENAKRIKHNRNVINFIAWIIAIFLIFVSGLGIYTTFFKSERSINETAAYVDLLNKQTNYSPVAWTTVQGFIKQTIPDQLSYIIQVKNNDEFTIDANSISVYDVQMIDNNRAVVRFDVKTSLKRMYMRGIISRDPKTRTYKWETRPSITYQPKSSSKYKEDSDLLTLDSSGVRSDEDTKKIENFLNTFYGLLYTDPSSAKQFYSGDISSLNITSGYSFNNIDSIKSYKKPNTLGFNTIVTYKLTQNNIEYSITQYLNVTSIKVDGKNSYMITSIF